MALRQGVLSISVIDVNYHVTTVGEPPNGANCRAHREHFGPKNQVRLIKNVEPCQVHLFKEYGVESGVIRKNPLNQ